VNLYFDLDTGVFCSAPGSRDTVSSLSFKRGDLVPIALRFVSGITAQELPAEATGQIGIKATGDYDGGFIAATGPWVKSGTGADTVYTFQLDLHTEAINTLLGYGPAEDVPSMQAMLELEYEATGIRTSSNTVLATIFNDVVRGDEGTPTPPPEVIGTTAPANNVFASTQRESVRYWMDTASSADGSKLVAAAYNGKIYTSADSGATWTARESDRDWYAVASSAAGTKLAAAVFGGYIYTSADSGVTWTAGNTGSNWISVASSDDGTKLVACPSSGPIYTSADSGATWTARTTSRTYKGVASSADGTKLAAVVDGGQIYTSTDSGATWTARDSSRSWACIASSADGTKLVACVQGGQVYTSADSGATWTARESSRWWGKVASSADGAKLVALASGESVYTSADSGVTWTARESVRSWGAIASSADGNKMVAAVANGYIYMLGFNPTAAPPYIRTAGGFLYIQEAGVWKKTALSAL
jgi:hypothetical protein